MELSKERDRYGVGDVEYYISSYDLVFVVRDNNEEQINMCSYRPPHTVQTNLALCFRRGARHNASNQPNAKRKKKEYRMWS
jgi:hypothetical protein